MPPKRKRATDGGDDMDADEKQVLDYLKRTNRPYSAGDISSNLHNTVTKTAVQRILTQLAARDKIVAKTYGKQQIYFMRQDAGEAPSGEALSTMDNKLEQLKKEVAALNQSTKESTAQLRALTSEKTDEEARNALQAVQQETEQLEAKLDALRKGGATKIDPKERKRVEAELEKNRAVWKQRKRMFNDVFGAMAENHPSKPKALLAEMGIETDEDAGVDYAKAIA